MKASTFTSTPPLPMSLAAPAQILLLAEHVQRNQNESFGKPHGERIQIRANTITVVLSDIMTHDACYRDFGIND